MTEPERPVTTPDGRYIVVQGRLWRASNPHLEPTHRHRLVEELMDARRAVRAALRNGDTASLRAARSQVQASKEALGERGPIWWADGAPDLNRRLVKNTDYAQWWQARADC